MSAAGTCPDCSEDLLPNASSCKCGWRSKPVRSIATAGERAKVRDPDWWRCSYYDRGERCNEAGGISTTTHGGGPWYCRDHYGRITSPASGKAPPGAFQSLRQIVGKAAPVRDDVAAAPDTPRDFEADEERRAIERMDEGTTK